jgi:hypothetical protein
MAILKRQLFDPIKNNFNQQIVPPTDYEGDTFSFFDQQIEIKEYLKESGYEYVEERVFHNFDMNEKQKRLVFKKHFKKTREEIVPIHFEKIAA